MRRRRGRRRMRRKITTPPTKKQKTWTRKSRTTTDQCIEIKKKNCIGKLVAWCLTQLIHVDKIHYMVSLSLLLSCGIWSTSSPSRFSSVSMTTMTLRHPNPIGEAVRNINRSLNVKPELIQPPDSCSCVILACPCLGICIVNCQFIYILHATLYCYF